MYYLVPINDRIRFHKRGEPFRDESKSVTRVMRVIVCPVRNSKGTCVAKRRRLKAATGNIRRQKGEKSLYVCLSMLVWTAEIESCKLERKAVDPAQELLADYRRPLPLTTTSIPAGLCTLLIFV